eukprot:scaffold131299_cov28-Tisochrysis_lutea.AAC.4
MPRNAVAIVPGLGGSRSASETRSDTPTASKSALSVSSICAWAWIADCSVVRTVPPAVSNASVGEGVRVVGSGSVKVSGLIVLPWSRIVEAACTSTACAVGTAIFIRSPAQLIGEEALVSGSDLLRASVPVVLCTRFAGPARASIACDGVFDERIILSVALAPLADFLDFGKWLVLVRCTRSFWLEVFKWSVDGKEGAFDLIWAGFTNVSIIPLEQAFSERPDIRAVAKAEILAPWIVLEDLFATALEVRAAVGTASS